MERQIIYSDFLEKQIGEALEAAGIKFVRPERLDFYLPDQNVFIEIKQYHSQRSNEQLASQDNVILIQGPKTVDFFCQLLKDKNCV